MVKNFSEDLKRPRQEPIARVNHYLDCMADNEIGINKLKSQPDKVNVIYDKYKDSNLGFCYYQEGRPEGRPEEIVKELWTVAREIKGE